MTLFSGFFIIPLVIEKSVLSCVGFTPYSASSLGPLSETKVARSGRKIWGASLGNSQFFNLSRYICLFLSMHLFSDLIDLESLTQDFVLETKRIEISAYPHAFNPSIIRWRGYILMSFRVIPNPKRTFTSWMGLILLDDAFNPLGEPQILQVRENDSLVPPRAEDARLTYIGERLYIIYSDNPNPEITAGGFRMQIGELHYENGYFSICNISRLTEYQGEMSLLREKNWVPFEYRNSLFLSYSLDPHLVFYPIPFTSQCQTVGSTKSSILWDWGILRGGTPALPLETGEYLSFFHSVKRMATANSGGKEMAHYFIGAYTFSPEPPFCITRFSPEPIVGPGFYSGDVYKPYWAPIQCVFPAGMIIEGDALWIAYGRQDHEIWVAKLDKNKLLDSLTRVNISGSGIDE